MCRLKTLAAAATVALFCGSGSAAADSFYAGLHGGLNIVHGTDVTEPVPFYVDITFEPGGVFGGFLGYQLDNGFRFEGEITSRANGIDEVDGFPLSGNITSTAFMANAFYEFSSGASIRPYLGAGIGLATVDMNELALGGLTFIDDSDTVLAYQFIGGLSVPVAATLMLTLDYRYFATENPRYVDFATDIIEIRYQNSAVLLGLRALF